LTEKEAKELVIRREKEGTGFSGIKFQKLKVI
jgi:hypothetical protein